MIIDNWATPPGNLNPLRRPYAFPSRLSRSRSRPTNASNKTMPNFRTSMTSVFSNRAAQAEATTCRSI
jgi:hypothetical protein